MEDFAEIFILLLVLGSLILVGALFLSSDTLNESFNNINESINELECSTQVGEELTTTEEAYTTVSQVEEKTNDARIKVSSQNNRNQVNVERYNYLKNKVTLPTNIYLSNLNKVFTKSTADEKELKYFNQELKTTFYIQKDIGSVFYIFDEFEFEGLVCIVQSHNSVKGGVA